MNTAEAISIIEDLSITYLPTKDLLSLIIGNEEKIEELFKNEKNIYQAINKSPCEMEFKGLTKLQANKIAACVEIGKRMSTLKYQDKIHIRGPKETADYFMTKMRFLTKERFIVLFLNTKNRIIGEQTISEGTLTGCLVHPREVYQSAILKHAAAIIVAHNHPSGDPNPSREDRELTDMLFKAGKTIGIPLLDHIVIGDGIYYSFQENSLLED